MINGKAVTLQWCSYVGPRYALHIIKIQDCTGNAGRIHECPSHLKITSKKSVWHTADTKLINFGYVTWNDCKFEHSYNGPNK